jgi:hypothetical protein
VRLKSPLARRSHEPNTSVEWLDSARVVEQNRHPSHSEAEIDRSTKPRRQLALEIDAADAANLVRDIQQVLADLGLAERIRIEFK